MYYECGTYLTSRVSWMLFYFTWEKDLRWLFHNFKWSYSCIDIRRKKVRKIHLPSLVQTEISTAEQFMNFCADIHGLLLTSWCLAPTADLNCQSCSEIFYMQSPVYVRLFSCSLTQMANQPITWPQLIAFGHVVMVKTTCWKCEHQNEEKNCFK